MPACVRHVVFHFAFFAAAYCAPAAADVRVWQGTLTLPTYEEGLPDVNPPFDLFALTRFKCRAEGAPECTL